MRDAVEWRTRAFILFNKEKFHSRLVFMLENGFEINDAAAYSDLLPSTYP